MLKRVLIHLWLAGAFSMALGHNLLPHEHHQASHDHHVCEVKGGDMDLLGWIKLALSHDMGHGHLEHFKQVKVPKVSSTWQLPALPTPKVPFLLNLPQLASYEGEPHFTITHKGLFSLPPNTFRGPPTQV